MKDMDGRELHNGARHGTAQGQTDGHHGRSSAALALRLSLRFVRVLSSTACISALKERNLINTLSSYFNKTQTYSCLHCGSLLLSTQSHLTRWIINWGTGHVPGRHLLIGRCRLHERVWRSSVRFIRHQILLVVLLLLWRLKD